MPWWAVIYLTAFVALMVVGQALELREKPKLYEWVCDGLASVIFAVLFLGYWIQFIHLVLGQWWVPLFLASICWVLYSDSATMRAILRDQELSKAEKVGLLVVPPLFGWPLYVIAGLGLIRGAQ